MNWVGESGIRFRLILSDLVNFDNSDIDKAILRITKNFIINMNTTNLTLEVLDFFKNNALTDPPD